MPDVPANKPPSRVASFLEKVSAAQRARLAFVIDATASREPTWDMAAQLQAQMFEETAKLGGLETQLIYYRGSFECSHSAWMIDAHAMARLMSKVKVPGGPYQNRQGAGARAPGEPAARKVAARIVFVGDAMEEEP